MPLHPRVMSLDELDRLPSVNAIPIPVWRFQDHVGGWWDVGSGGSVGADPFWVKTRSPDQTSPPFDA